MAGAVKKTEMIRHLKGIAMKTRNSRAGIASWRIVPFLLFLLPYVAALAAPDEDHEDAGDFLKREEWFFRPRQQGLPKGERPAGMRFKARQRVKTMPKARGPVMNTAVQ